MSADMPPTQMLFSNQQVSGLPLISYVIVEVISYQPAILRYTVYSESFHIFKCKIGTGLENYKFLQISEDQTI